MSLHTYQKGSLQELGEKKLSLVDEKYQQLHLIGNDGLKHGHYFLNVEDQHGHDQ